MERPTGVRVMNPDTMLTTIKKLGSDVQVNGNVVQFEYENATMVLIYDVQADRMRLICPIAELDDLEESMVFKAMEANFHTTLDVRYAISDGVVWSAFIHPMSELSNAFFESAIDQVATAQQTFGSEYTSGSLVFGSQTTRSRKH